MCSDSHELLVFDKNYAIKFALVSWYLDTINCKVGQSLREKNDKIDMFQ